MELKTQVAIASALIHAEEAFSPTGHPFDIEAFRSSMEAPGVKEWIEALNQQGFLPVKRQSPTPSPINE